VGVQEVRWDRGGTEPAGVYADIFAMERKVRIMNYGYDFVYLPVREASQQLRG
jgi:hypothetical protein